MSCQQWKPINIPQLNELYFICESNCKLLLSSGAAEISGWELYLGQAFYLNKGISSKIVSFKGCRLDYISDKFIYFMRSIDLKNPSANIYMNLHFYFENKRGIQSSNIPRILVLGNHDEDHHDLFKTLANYHLKKNHDGLLLVDTDIENNCISIPGTLASIVATLPCNANDEWNLNDETLMLVHPEGSYDIEIFKKQIEKLAEMTNEKLNGNSELNKNGLIVNCHSFKCEMDSRLEEYREFLLELINLFQINSVIVFDKFFEILFPGDNSFELIVLPKITKEYSLMKEEIKVLKISQYFLGNSTNIIIPNDVKAVKNNQRFYSKYDRKSDLVEVQNVSTLIDRIVAISQTTDPEELFTTPIYGYGIIIQMINFELTLLIRVSSKEKRLPGKMFYLTHFISELELPY